MFNDRDLKIWYVVTSAGNTRSTLLIHAKNKIIYYGLDSGASAPTNGENTILAQKCSEEDQTVNVNTSLERYMYIQ